MHFSYRAILSTLILSIGLTFISSNALVLAQTTDSNQTNESDESPFNQTPSNQKPESSPTPRHRTPTSNPTPSNQPQYYERSPRNQTRPSVESGTSSSNNKRVQEIQNQVLSNQQVKNSCQDISGDIKFQLQSDRLKIVTRNHQCSYKIVQEILERQLKEGRIKTYEFSGDQEDVIVTF